MRRVVAAAAVLLCTLVTTVACGDEESPDTSEGGSEQEVQTIEITFADGVVTPNGERVEVDAGQPVDLVVTADEPGEIHMHTSPEQTFAYDAGTETFEFQVDRPGVVEVESHDLEQVIVQLEVR